MAERLAECVDVGPAGEPQRADEHRHVGHPQVTTMQAITIFFGRDYLWPQLFFGR